MKKENEEKVDRKELYKLLWEYLRASKRYEKFCKWSRKWHGKKQKVSDLSEEFTGMTLVLFGDVFENSFEDWWKTKKDKERIGAVEGVVELERKQVLYEINTTIRRFVESHGRKPSLDEFKEGFLERLFNHLPVAFLFRAHFPLNPNVDMVAQFIELLEKKENLKQVRNFMRRNRYIGKVYYDTLKDDLKIYCLRENEGLKIKEIIKKLDPSAKEHECNDVNVQRKIRQKIARARNIIEDLERPCFPRKLE